MNGKGQVPGGEIARTNRHETVRCPLVNPYGTRGWTCRLTFHSWMMPVTPIVIQNLISSDSIRFLLTSASSISRPSIPGTCSFTRPVLFQVSKRSAQRWQLEPSSSARVQLEFQRYDLARCPPRSPRPLSPRPSPSGTMSSRRAAGNPGDRPTAIPARASPGGSPSQCQEISRSYRIEPPDFADPRTRNWMGPRDGRDILLDQVQSDGRRNA